MKLIIDLIINILIGKDCLRKIRIYFCATLKPFKVLYCTWFRFKTFEWNNFKLNIKGLKIKYSSSPFLSFFLSPSLSLSPPPKSNLHSRKNKNAYKDREMRETGEKMPSYKTLQNLAEFRTFTVLK